MPVLGALKGPQFMCPNHSKGEVISSILEKSYTIFRANFIELFCRLTLKQCLKIHIIFWCWLYPADMTVFHQLQCFSIAILILLHWHV